MSLEKNQPNPYLTLCQVAGSCILAGAAFGAVSNMIDGAISPYYFKTVMHWDFPDIWTAAVSQGLFEGLIYGTIFSIIFTTGFGLITKGKAGYGFAFTQLLKTIGFIGICWLCGGLFAILLTSINPDFYRKLFPITPKDGIEMLKFAWTGGSIWGGMIGGLLSSFLAVVMLKNRWLQSQETEE